LRILVEHRKSQTAPVTELAVGEYSRKVDEKRAAKTGYSEPKFDVHFTEGEEIFRHYIGVEYRAIATKGKLLLLNNKTVYGSLNQLNEAIVSGRENAWGAWEIVRSGRPQKVSELRNQKKVRRRPKIDVNNLDLSGLDLEL